MRKSILPLKQNKRMENWIKGSCCSKGGTWGSEH